MEYLVTLTGTQPLIMHRDNVGWSGEIKSWQQNPENKKFSVAGDDRSPAWTWLGSLYHNDEIVAMSVDNIMTMLREGGALTPVPGGKNGKTFKAQTQSGIMPVDAFWPLVVDGEEVAVEGLLALKGEMDFDAHLELAKSLGFELFVKRAKVGQSKHVRVRPRFNTWQLSGMLRVTDKQISLPVLTSILDMAGKFKGLGDWRPSSKTPGWYGTFTATVEEV